MATFTSYLVFSLLFLQLSSTQLNLANANGLCSSSNKNESNVSRNEEGKWMKLYPLIKGKQMKKMMLMMNETRRKLGSFQLCAPCTCCGAKGYCLPSPCCYAINCNIPNRPFGYCSFTPRTCNCFGCHL